MLSHVDEFNRPTMVDVSNKEVTHRAACARALVIFPEDLLNKEGVNRS